MKNPWNTSIAILVASLLTAVTSCSSDQASDDGSGGASATGGDAATGGAATNCGNGVLDPGETCDPSAAVPCNTDCNDNDGCTTDLLDGTPLTCDVVCTNTPRTACEPNDACCPAGCTADIDSDCSGGATGGAGGTGGMTTGGAGAPTGGTTGGAGASGGTPTGGGGAATGGVGAGGAATGGVGAGGVGTGGEGTGGEATGGSTMTLPCDIAGDASTPCIAAYSMVRKLSSTYTGPLYQVRRGGPDPNTGQGGETQDIMATASGFGDADAQDAFCAGQTCTLAVLYDQSGQGNDLTVAPAGCYEGTASEDDYESDVTRQPVSLVGGNRAYGLYMDKHEGYRDNTTTGVPTGSQDSTVYMVAAGSGLRPNAGCCCCWNFGTASTNNCYGPTGMMAALYLGTGYWGSGAGRGPWFLGDFEAGVWAGGTGESNANNPNSPSMTMDFAYGMLKTGGDSYALKMGDATTGDLTTAYDGAKGNWNWVKEAGIILGIGGDNSNSSDGTFFEGIITQGWTSNEVDEALYRNVQGVQYAR